MIGQKIDPEALAAYQLVGSMRADKFCSVFGYRRTEIDSKIKRKEWVENVHYEKDPDGRVHIILLGYKSWLHKEQKAIESEMERSRSGLLKKAKQNARIKHLIPPSTPIPDLA